MEVPGFTPEVNAEVSVNPGAMPDQTGNDGKNGSENPGNPPTGTESGAEGGQNSQPDAQTQEPRGTQKSETPSNDADTQFNEIIEGWKEDRMALQTATTENRALKDEVRDLKGRLARYENGESEEDEFEGLSPREREQKIIERHEKQKAEETMRMKDEVAKEISFHERTNPEFRANKDAILKIASDFNATNLEQATKIWKAQQAVAQKAAKAKEIDDKRKREAAGANGGTSGGSTVRPYDPTVDGKKSISDLYREGGVS
jgi:hypothetical protein